ncbi:MAG: methyltransferase domain-containing protein, partial [Candidatus Bathyarchaeota archaeon]|nr:methyltransferase domain-containing protein [Candidatus Bathyarchaeota archaeon]
VMQRYDLTAHFYDMRYAEEQTAKIEAVMESISMEKEGLVLDVGCGTGLLFEYISHKAEAIVGLDISRETLLQAKKCAKKFTNVHLILADSDNVPLKEDVFVYVFALTLIQNTPNPLKTLNEIKQVSKENAVIVVTGLKKKFPVKAFKRLLHDAGFGVIAVKSESLKSHVAVCTKFLH